jgi:UDP-N-acetylmuramyl pentapeptide synthase
MGTNHFGELANLCAIAEPEIAAITNIGKAHLEVFRDLDGVARAKSELIEPLPQEGIAVLNADDSRYPYLRSRTRARVVTFGLDGPRADVRGSDVCRSSDGFEFLVNGRYRAELRVPGEYNVRNVLAAMALGYASGLPLADLAEGVRSLELPDLRMQVIPAGEVRVVLDAYNANPSSMEAALAEFAQWRVSGRKVVLLGDMLELGELSREWHRDLGRKVLTMAPDVVITVGEAMIDLQAVLSESGFPNGRRHHFLRTAEAEEAVPGLLLPGDTLFIKGSRAMGLEVLARSLSGAWDKEKGQ